MATNADTVKFKWLPVLFFLLNLLLPYGTDTWLKSLVGEVRTEKLLFMHWGSVRSSPEVEMLSVNRPWTPVLSQGG